MNEAKSTRRARMVQASVVEWTGRVSLHQAACLSGGGAALVKQRRLEALAAAEALLDVQAEAFRL